MRHSREIKGAARIESHARHVQHANDNTVEFDPLTYFSEPHNVYLLDCTRDTRGAAQYQSIDISLTGLTRSSERTNEGRGCRFLSGHFSHNLTNIREYVRIVPFTLP